MNLDPKQQHKLEKLAEYADDKDLATLEHFLSIEEKLDEHKECMDSMKADMEEMKNKEIPEPIDHTEHLKEIIEKLDEEEEIEITLNII